ncbi:MAG: T9SS type A sorting domain-containing protein [Candidatus Kapaibacterium sp.]
MKPILFLICSFLLTGQQSFGQVRLLQTNGSAQCKTLTISGTVLLSNQYLPLANGIADVRLTNFWFNVQQPSQHYKNVATQLEPIEVSPLPVIDIAKIHINDIVESESSIKFFDLKGQQLSAKVISITHKNIGSDIHIDVSMIPDGYYYIKVTTATASYNTTVVIEH